MTRGSTLDYNPYAADFYTSDPISVYRWMRDEAPVYHSEQWGWYALSRFDDVRGAAIDADTFRSFEGMDIDDTGKGAEGTRLAARHAGRLRTVEPPGLLPQLTEHVRLEQRPRHLPDLRTAVAQTAVPGRLKDAFRSSGELGALTLFDGAGITRCDCPVCAGRDLLRFDRSYHPSVPAEIGREAMLHDLHCVVALAQRILTSPDPAAWIRECRNAGDVAHGIAADHRVLLTVPPSGSCQVK